MGKLSFQFVVSCFLVSPTPTIYAALVDIMCTSLACEAGDQMPQVHCSYIYTHDMHIRRLASRKNVVYVVYFVVKLHCTDERSTSTHVLFGCAPVVKRLCRRLVHLGCTPFVF